ncbi:hypothetical protein [Winogradskyella sp. R77965]|uniref:hypothetical protein n=1 Tax=Winogradskyella sp. R77965 TaxID=3093872 RepID=UPI0037DDD7ED
MKKITFLLLLISLFSCKDGKQKYEYNDGTEKNQSSSNIIKEINIGGIDKWELRGVKLIDIDSTYLNNKIFKMKVVDHEESYAFAAINNIKLAYTGGRYRISMIVKPSKENENYGIRIQEVYPSRFDAVFDLDNEVVRGTYQKGDFIEKNKIEVEPIDNGWYKCMIDTYIYASYFRLVFGPTNVPKDQTKSWESELLNNSNREILILPNSIRIEELEH